MTDPHAQYKFPDGTLKGYYRKSMDTVFRNLHAAAYDSTPGAPVSDYRGGDPNQPYERPITEEEAASARPSFERASQEAEAREPGIYAAWRERYLTWKGGDLTRRLIQPGEVVAELRNDTSK